MMRKQGVRSNLRLSLCSFVISIGRLSLILNLVECTHKQTFLPDKIFHELLCGPLGVDC